jgi:metal-responsive CopG/Arc/MetJ family transcriptional regulator
MSIRAPEGNNMSKNRDRRISVSLDAKIAQKLDDHVAHTPDTNRSQEVERAVNAWFSDSLAHYTDKEQVLQEAMKLYEEQQERELYRAYYAELSDEMRSELAAWTEASEETAARHWPKSIAETSSAKTSTGRTSNAKTK